MTLQEFARAVIYGTPGDDHQLLPFDTPVVVKRDSLVWAHELLGVQ